MGRSEKQCRCAVTGQIVIARIAVGKAVFIVVGVLEGEGRCLHGNVGLSFEGQLIPFEDRAEAIKYLLPDGIVNYLALVAHGRIRVAVINALYEKAVVGVLRPCKLLRISHSGREDILLRDAAVCDAAVTARAVRDADTGAAAVIPGQLHSDIFRL